jgi:hypothetical protein
MTVLAVLDLKPPVAMFAANTFPVTYKLEALTFDEAETFPVANTLVALRFEATQTLPELVRFAADTLPVTVTFVNVVTAPVIVNVFETVKGPAKDEGPSPWTTAFPVVTTSPKLVMVGILY